MTVGPDANTQAPRAVPKRAPRPRSLRIDPARCIACETCEAFVPGWLDASGSVAVSPSALDAMAACPAGAIVWVEPGDAAPDRIDPDA